MSRGRLRAVLALVGLALAAPTALLVHRALRSASAEEAARHRAVAERVFDEMERALSAFVAREEERPVEAWSDAGPARLAALPEEPFVLGYFQLGPDGRVTTPLAARDEGALRAATAWFTARDEPARRQQTQAPGTTVSLQSVERPRPGTRDAAPAKDAAPRAAAPAPDTAYDALQSLNRGASGRAERQRKLVERPAEAAVELLDQRAGEAPAPLSPRAADARVEARVEAEGQAAAAAPAVPPHEPGRGRSGTVRLAVDPLVGRIVGDRQLLLYRSVFAGEVALRQGLVLDVEMLGAWLRDQALGALRLPGARLAFHVAPTAPFAPAPEARSYRHRFAEPFDGLAAELALPPLGGVGGAGTIYALAGLLALAGAASLVAIHRTVTVALRFAERRSNFVAAVTHELKTPLTAIRMYGEMLRDGLVSTEAKRREYYATITAESARLARLIDNVLEFSRLERGAREMRLVTDSPGPVVEEVGALLRPHAERTGFALRLDIEPGLPPVRFERDALRQVLVNLVDNATKYAHGAASPEIAIACRRHADGVVLAVRDHGPGVPGRHLARIFEPFHRGENELTRTTQGTGLGLALVKSLVERMGGAVDGRNAPDGGFEVRVALPAAPARASGPTRDAGAPETPGVGHRRDGPRS